MQTVRLPSLHASKEDDPPPPIINGMNTTEGEFPYFVDWGPCGGSLVHQDIVLTAAHCQHIADTNVYVGALRCQTESGITQKRLIEVEQIHPDYDEPSSRFDVMVLKLTEPSNLSTITLHSDPKQPSTNEMLAAIGHGVTETGSSSEFLLRVTVPRMSDDYCKNSYPGFERPFGPKIMLCAGYKEGGKDTCQGDSGGPLIETRSGIDIQVGITSWGGTPNQPCAYRNLPGVYVKVSSVKGWIDEQTCRLSRHPPYTCYTNVKGTITLWNGVANTTTSPTQRIKVTLRSKGSSWSKSTTTNSQGAYQFVENLVDVGEYFITVDAPSGYGL